MEEDNFNENEWGSKRNEYYERNKLTRNDENYIEEEQEAIKIQQSKLKKFQELNMLDSDSDIEKSQPEKHFDRYNLDSSSDSDEKSEVKMKNIKLDKEEQIQLLTNIKKQIDEIENFTPAIEVIQNNLVKYNSDQNMKETNKYLERKRKLHLIYSILMNFYLFFKNKDKISDHHPVLKKMLFVKSLLDDMENFDVNLFHEIDKILKLVEINTEIDNESDKSSSHDIEINNKKTFLGKKTTRDVVLDNQERIKNLREENSLNQSKNKKKLLKEIQDKNEKGKRHANEQILKARGIVRKRKKYQGNAKLHLREKYYKKQKERKNFVKEYEGKPQVYGGEITGIRRDLIRSTKLK